MTNDYLVEVEASMGGTPPINAQMIQFSIAISLKRIADILSRYEEREYGEQEKD